MKLHQIEMQYSLPFLVWQIVELFKHVQYGLEDLEILLVHCLHRDEYLKKDRKQSLRRRFDILDLENTSAYLSEVYVVVLGPEREGLKHLLQTNVLEVETRVRLYCHLELRWYVRLFQWLVLAIGHQLKQGRIQFIIRAKVNYFTVLVNSPKLGGVIDHLLEFQIFLYDN